MFPGLFSCRTRTSSHKYNWGKLFLKEHSHFLLKYIFDFQSLGFLFRFSVKVAKIWKYLSKCQNKWEFFFQKFYSRPFHCNNLKLFQYILLSLKDRGATATKASMARALPKFWVTVNPISTRGADYAHHSTMGLV